MRLAKYLAHAGVASRRAAEEIVRDGRVTVGGRIVTDPARDVDDASDVAVDGRVLGGAEGRVTYALNKPAGVVSTASDPQGRRTVVDLVSSGGRRLYPVGRLDVDATGLLIVTNDGDLANHLTHPRYEVPKTYRVTIAGGPMALRKLQALREGVRLEDGLTAPARVRRIDDATIELTIHEGRNRQVKRMCEAVGHRVIRLARIRFGPLELGSLRPGQVRKLSEPEVAELRRAAGRG
jgi:23S rRNA pseudouridine2605 synthase